MAILGTSNPTLADLAKVTDPDGSIADVVEILNQTNEILADMTWQEGNLTTGNRSSIRTGLPTPTFRKLYGFVAPTKSRSTQVTDNTAMMEDYSEVDKALVDMAGNPAAFRLQEDRPHIEGMNQTLATKLFYGMSTEEKNRVRAFRETCAEVADADAPKRQTKRLRPTPTSRPCAR